MINEIESLIAEAHEIMRKDNSIGINGSVEMGNGNIIYYKLKIKLKKQIDGERNESI